MVKILAWALYDCANTIFATNVVSLYFPLWVTVQNGASDIFYILPYYLSISLAIFILPLSGILADSLKRYSLFLNIFTLGCILLTSFIGVWGSLFIGIICFTLANLFNQVAANVFYPSLLPRISSSKNIPLVSGLGVALGYVGTIIGISFIRLFIKEGDYTNTFLPTALLFLLFFLPCFLFIKDEAEKIQLQDFKDTLKSQWQKLKITLATIKENKIALRFFCSFLFIINGINGVLLNIGVYGKRVMGFLDSELPLFIIISTIFAFFSAFVFGFIVRKIGAKKALSFILLGWVLGLTVLAFISGKRLCWIIGPCMGILLAGTWVCLRPFIIRLAHQDKIGEFFGFTGLASILGALFSPLIWLVVITVFAPLGLVRYRIGIFTLALLIFTGFILLQKVPETRIME
jgi:UMF1 family MFS transporter